MTAELWIALGGFLLACGAIVYNGGRQVARVDVLDQKVDERFKSVRDLIGDRFDSLSRRLDWNRDVFETFRQDLKLTLKTLTETSVAQGTRLAVIEEMAERWEEGRLHPRVKNGGET